MRWTLLLPLLGCGLAWTGLAQEEDEPRGRTLRLLALGDEPPFRQEIRDGVRIELEPPAGSIPPRVVRLGLGEEEADAGEVGLRLGRPSERIALPAGEGPLVLRDAEGGAWLRLERPAAGDFLVLLWRDPEAADWSRARSLVLPDGERLFPAGGARVVNISTTPVGLVIGEERIALPPGRSHLLEVAAGEEPTFQLGAPDAAGNLRQFFSGSLVQNPGERTLVVVFRADGEEPRRPLKVLSHREPVRPLQPREIPAAP